jgi:ADP-ribosylglycohydrolase
MNATLESRIYGCWLGKSIGGTLGLPSEGRMQRQHYTYYDPVPMVAPPNDDLELQLVWLHLVESSGSELTKSNFAAAWLRHIHYMWDEYGRCRWNLRRGVSLDDVGIFENPFHAAMGSPIRSEIWACLFPGDAGSAGYYAALDASLDHGEEGIAGEVFFAVMQSLVLAGSPLREAVDAALRQIPAGSETARALDLVLAAHRDGWEVWSCWQRLLDLHGNENFTHAPLNVALTLWALLYGEEDFEKSILLATNGGYDTDCTAATVAATLGMMPAVSISDRWKAPIGEGVYLGPGILEVPAPRTLGELTQRTGALIGKLSVKSGINWVAPHPQVPPDLRGLAGTIELQPLDNSAPVLWSNGELPAAVKAAGGATWRWEVADQEPRVLVCLARAGAKLSINEKTIVHCPPGQPYVLAPHRCPRESRSLLTPGLGLHAVKLELDSYDAAQDVSVLLAYANYHLCPWTSEELPHRAQLPASG